MFSPHFILNQQAHKDQVARASRGASNALCHPRGGLPRLWDTLHQPHSPHVPPCAKEVFHSVIFTPLGKKQLSPEGGINWDLVKSRKEEKSTRLSPWEKTTRAFLLSKACNYSTKPSDSAVPTPHGDSNFRLGCGERADGPALKAPLGDKDRIRTCTQEAGGPRLAGFDFPRSWWLFTVTREISTSFIVKNGNLMSTPMYSTGWKDIC